MNVNVERLWEIAVAIAERRWGELNMRIPADESRDADLVVAAAAREIPTLRAERDAAIRRVEALREAVDALLEVAEQSVDTRQCSLGILRAMNQARAAIDAARAGEER